MPASTPPASTLPPSTQPASTLQASLLLARVLSHQRCTAAATAFASELAMAWGCTRVCVGFCRRDVSRVVAVSGGGSGTMDGVEYDAIAEAMDEARQQDTSLLLPAPPGGRSLVSIAHQRLRQRHGGSVLTIPLMQWGRPVGAVTLEWSEVRPEVAGRLPELETTIGLVGPVLDLLRRREKSLRIRLADGLRRGARLAWGRPRARLATGAVALALLAVTALPVPHRVGGIARVEGLQQRTLVAPMDGFLKTVNVRPGDAVRRGQVLLELADEDLVLQSRKWASEIGQQEHAYSAALAADDRSAMVIALARADQARSQLALVEADRARARIVAPFDGVVLQGDLSQQVGAPLERGKSLLVLAPGEHQRLIVHVDERDVDRVQAGQTGRLAVSALPWDTIGLTVLRVTPVARIEEGRNGFEVEARIDPAQQHRIRPGLSGVARIGVGYAPLAWVWTHRLLDRVRLAWWRWWA